MRTLLLSTITLIWSLNATGNTIDSLKNEPRKTISPEIDLYQRLYESEKASNERLINFIYVTLGSGGGILLFIVGSQIFFNYKINSAEVDSIKNDLKKSFAEFKGDIERENQKLYNKIESETKKLLDGEIEVVSTTVDKNLKDLNIKIDQKVDDISFDLYRTRADLYSDQQPNNFIAISHYIEAAKAGIKGNIKINSTLNQLIKICKDVNNLSDRMHSILSEFVKTIPISHSKEIEELNEYLSTVGIFKLDEASGGKYMQLRESKRN
ncbi:MAG: hypothetical protein JSS79_19070 [Bacteroidetes bacterium]|nr:hypothetical protein [Bacteroidota bacterium]